MKMTIKNPLLLPALIGGIGLILAGRVTAQTFTTLHDFAGYPNDGEDPQPEAVLILSDNTLYGTAFDGGSGQSGTVFAIKTDGSDYTNLYNFTEGILANGNINYPVYTNSDGARPLGGLVLSGNTLYGVAASDGILGNGTVFALNTNGTGFTVLYSFTGGSDGAGPCSTLILSGNTLYGTASGGSSGQGTVFALKTDGTGFTNLHGFTTTSGYGGIEQDGTNSDGVGPRAGLILSGNTLYGTAWLGGSSGNGTVFALNTNGTGFMTLHSFTETFGNVGPYGTNGDGAEPWAGLVISGNTLYGTASVGGNSGVGTVFALNTDGTGFTVLHSFAGPDGLFPYGGLVLSSNTLYGTACDGGTYGNGTVFDLKTNGTDFETFHNFGALYPSTNGDGVAPWTGLAIAGNTLYGTTPRGGSSIYDGTVFSLTLGSVSPLQPAPLLAIIRSGPNVILTWTNTATGFTLQSTTNLLSARWSTNSPAPIVINGQFTVTNSISGTAMFYRLSQ
jgi:uncharacterized repeat protein (TIGR03803 family)